MRSLANTPQPPYFAVIFTSIRAKSDNGYEEMADKMLKLASLQEGFLGVDSAREDIGITVSYWQSEESIKAWKNNAAHQLARQYGREHWYKSFKIRVCKVEREYGL